MAPQGVVCRLGEDAVSAAQECEHPYGTVRPAYPTSGRRESFAPTPKDPANGRCESRPSLTNRRGDKSVNRGSVYPQAIEEPLVGPPRPSHPHREVEVHTAAELALELPAGGRGGLPRYPPPRPAAETLLGLGLRPRERADPDHALARLVDLVDHDLDGVRHLLPRSPQHLLADELGQHDLLRLVRAGLGREEEGALGEEAQERLAERVDARPAPGREREDLLPD